MHPWPSAHHCSVRGAWTARYWNVSALQQLGNRLKNMVQISVGYCCSLGSTRLLALLAGNCLEQGCEAGVLHAIRPLYSHLKSRLHVLLQCVQLSCHWRLASRQVQRFFSFCVLEHGVEEYSHHEKSQSHEVSHRDICVVEACKMSENRKSAARA